MTAFSLVYTSGLSCHGIRNVGIHGEKSEPDLDGANKFIGELSQFLLEEDIIIEDMDKRGLMWKAHKEHSSTEKINERKIKKLRRTE